MCSCVSAEYGGCLRDRLSRLKHSAPPRLTSRSGFIRLSPSLSLLAHCPTTPHLPFSTQEAAANNAKGASTGKTGCDKNCIVFIRAVTLPQISFSLFIKADQTVLLLLMNIHIFLLCAEAALCPHISCWKAQYPIASCPEAQLDTVVL